MRRQALSLRFHSPAVSYNLLFGCSLTGLRNNRHEGTLADTVSEEDCIRLSIHWLCQDAKEYCGARVILSSALFFPLPLLCPCYNPTS